jgi:hypothetical protein
LPSFASMQQNDRVEIAHFTHPVSRASPPRGQSSWGACPSADLETSASRRQLNFRDEQCTNLGSSRISRIVRSRPADELF